MLHHDITMCNDVRVMCVSVQWGDNDVHMSNDDKWQCATQSNNDKMMCNDM